MIFSPLAFAALPIVSTFIGGYTVYRWKRDLHPWLSLSGGLLLGVAFLDLLPEALERGTGAGVGLVFLTAAALISILFFHSIDQVFGVHAHHDHPSEQPTEPCDNDRHRRVRAWTRAAGMIVHSFCDGLAIGGGFAVDVQLGLLVTAAVVTHDFSDGMSTVTILKNALTGQGKLILFVLGLDALAPFVGSLVGTQLAPHVGVIALALAAFAGFFIFLALAELLPQAHAGRQTRRASLSLTLLGVLIVVFIRSFANV